MKKVISVSSILIMSFASTSSMASMSYECWSYVGGSPDKMVHVSANSNSDAVRFAEGKMNDLGNRFDSVKCK